jgi:DNA-binding transcriptional regulator WhiA
MKLFSVNENYFDYIDTREKAYVLGFIFADGNISDGKDKHYRLRITLKASDIEILQKIKEEIQFTGDIKTRELKSRKRDTTGYMISELSISNKHMINTLKRLGCSSNKSLTKKYPNIPSKYDKDFIRGYFDGNGSIYLTKDRLSTEIMSGSKEMFNSILTKIQDNLEGITSGGIKEKKTSISITKRVEQSKTILNWLYSDATIYLNRKYELYQQYAV